MSYDLFFRSSDPRVDRTTVLRWFSARPNYTVADNQVWYENPVSGVYFSFDLQLESGALLTFNLNYFRPDLFAREAELELAALVAAFDLTIDDPQADGMGAGRYSSEGFLRGWRTGNRLAHRVLASEVDQPPVLTLPQATNLGVWSWNLAREAYLDRLGLLDVVPCFVPTIFLLVPEAERAPVQTAVVWAERMQVALPEVDLVLALNERGARPLAVPFSALAPLLARYEKRPATHSFTLDGRSWSTGLPHWLVDYEGEPPADLVELLTTGGRFEPFKRVTPGEVLDRETFELARAEAGRTAPTQGEA